MKHNAYFINLHAHLINIYTLTHISITDSPVEFIKEKNKQTEIIPPLWTLLKNKLSYCQIPESGELINALQFCQDILYFLRTSLMPKLKYQRTHNTALQWWDKCCWRFLEWLLSSVLFVVFQSKQPANTGTLYF